MRLRTFTAQYSLVVKCDENGNHVSFNNEPAVSARVTHLFICYSSDKLMSCRGCTCGQLPKRRVVIDCLTKTAVAVPCAPISHSRLSVLVRCLEENNRCG